MRSNEKLYPMLTSANWLDNEVKNYLQYRKIYVKNQVIDPDVFLIMASLDVSKYVLIVYRKVSLLRVMAGILKTLDFFRIPT